MNARLAAFLTLAHAPSWRRRYGAEFCALLEELPATPAVVADATTSALSTQTPALVAVAAGILAAIALAFGPVSSDRAMMGRVAPHLVKPPAVRTSHVTCGTALAYTGTNATSGC